MKKYFLFFLLFIGCSGVVVKAEQPIRFGAVAGVNVSKYSYGSSDNIAGFHFGAKMEYSFADRLYLESGLLFTRKGDKRNRLYQHDSGEWRPAKITEKNHYLNLPIHLGCKFNMDSNVSFFVSGGGYLGVGLFGKNKGRTQDSNDNYTVKLYKSGEGDGYRRFDCGLGVKAGVEIYKRVQVSVSYDWGLVDVYKYFSSDYKNRNLMISCGYMF